MQAALEPRVRCLVADTLGVGIDELAPEVSLTDELAADSLDLAELLPARGRARPGGARARGCTPRTYGDLVRAAIAAAPERGAALARSTPRCRSGPAWSPRTASCSRGAPDAYFTRRSWTRRSAPAARRGSRSRSPKTASDVQLAHVRAEFAWLAEQGRAVAIRSPERSESRRPSAAA